VLEEEEFCVSAINAILTKIGINTSLQVDFCVNGSEAFNLIESAYKVGLGYKIILKDADMTVLNVNKKIKIKEHLTCLNVSRKDLPFII
jgi:hypothetical protein